MRIAQFSDLHYCPKHLDEVDRCFRYAVLHATRDDTIRAAIISGDLFDSRVDLHHPCVDSLLTQIRVLSAAMPVLILQGTQSHDVPGSLDIFRALEPRVFVADKICRVVLTNSDCWVGLGEGGSIGYSQDKLLVSCLPSLNKANVAAHVGVESAAEAVGDGVFELMKSWAPLHEEARKAGVPTVVVSHGTVTGCLTEHGVPMHGTDHEFTTGSLFAADADAVMLGHIHKHQSWAQPSGHKPHDAQIIAYPGSIGRLHFGEEDPKGFLVWDVTPADPSFEFVETPAKKLLHIEFDGPPDMLQLKRTEADEEDWGGHHIRIRWSVDEEYKGTVDREAIEAMFAGAAELQLEGRTNPTQRQRAAGITLATTVGDKLERWAEAVGTESAPLQRRLTLLESTDAEDILAEGPSVQAQGL